MNDTFVAIDFETANRYPNSACSIGMVRVESGEIVRTLDRLIRPPFDYFEFTDVHGLTWDTVRSAAPFAEVWPEMHEMIEGADYLVAHNAPFDRNVLYACCRMTDIKIPEHEFVCTVQVARNTWNIRPTRLNNVCDFLGIELNHHEALSDAMAAAKIMIASHGAAKKSK